MIIFENHTERERNLVWSLSLCIMSDSSNDQIGYPGEREISLPSCASVPGPKSLPDSLRFLFTSHIFWVDHFKSQVISFDWILSSLISSKEEMHWFTLTHCKNNFISLTKMAGPEECAPSAQGWCLSKSLNFWWTNASKCLEHLWFMVFKTWFFTITFFVK